ncbi:MAG: type II secretion system secretin GspD [Rhodoblastus sp.]|nr:MAG: type II secretion system secretin GspD [Rhodoblastus sp.]
MNVPVQQATKVVLGDIMGVEYVVDGKIDGRVTIQTPEPVEKSRALDLFRSALQTVNARVVETGGVYKVMSADQAVAAGMRLTTTEPGSGMIGDGANVVQLRHVSASEMRRVLEPIAPKGGVVGADDGRGILTLAGSPQDIASMREAIRVFDVDTMRGMSMALVPVRSAEPESLADDLRKAFGSEDGGAMNGMIRFVPNRRLRSILVISPQPKYLARAEALIRRLEAQAAGSEKQFYSYVVQNRPAKDLAAALNSMFAAETSASAASRQIAPRQQAVGVSNAAFRTTPNSSPGVSLSARSLQAWAAARPVHRPARPPAARRNRRVFRKGDATAPPAALGEETRMRISADDANNAILIMASPEDYRRLMRVVRSLDVMSNQVLIEATIAEVTLNDQLKFGVKWFLGRKASSATFSDQVSGAVSSLFPGFSYALKLANAQVTIDALQEVTDVNVLSSPSLMVMDNRTATLQVGDQVPITTQSAQSVLGVGAPIVNSVTYKDTGVILSITPRINDSGLVMLDIEQEVSSVTATISSGIDSPTIQQRRIKTSVLVNDRESITLGGLIQSKNNVSRSQTPVLGDIPLLGNAFKSKNDLTGKTELIIILTPRVVRNTVDARAVTEEFAERLRFNRPRARTTGRSFERTVRRLVD